MSKLRQIDGIYKAPEVHWVGDGFRVAGYFSRIPGALTKLSPFLMLDYHAPFTYPPTTDRRGVGPHPHRGFETVTMAWEGAVAHHDSVGNRGVIGPGDVQWMTAAGGILHQEYHEEGFAKAGGTFHMAQLWVNLPREHKMTPPRYQALTDAAIPRVAVPGGFVRVVGGTFRGTAGAARTFSPVTLLDVRLEAGATLDLSQPPQHNTAFLLTAGAATVNGTTKLVAADFLVFGHGGETIELRAAENLHLLVLGGEPIKEPIAQYGPFVMNTEAEIRTAIQDFNSGKFGSL